MCHLFDRKKIFEFWWNPLGSEQYLSQLVERCPTVRWGVRGGGRVVAYFNMDGFLWLFAVKQAFDVKVWATCVLLNR